jgi:hypothetical protein
MVDKLKENTMAKQQKLVTICALNDESSDAPIVFHFDNAMTRAEFLKLVDPRHGEFTVIDQLSAHDAAVIRSNVHVVTMGDIDEAKERGDAQTFLTEDDSFKFYDGGDELENIYDDQIASGKRVRGTGRTC